MHTIVVGTGYTGRRVLAMLPEGRGTGFARSTLDLDDPSLPGPQLPTEYALLYTVPPHPDSAGDERLKRLLSLLDPSPVRFVYLSTTGVYGDRRGHEVTEDDKPDPATERARRRLAAETLLASWCDDRHTEHVILRVPGIYGPGRLGIARIEAGEPLIREADAGPGNRIHIDDLAACCLRALSADAPPGIYNVGDGDHRSSTAFAKSVARLAGLESPPEISREEAESTLSEARLSFLGESRIVHTGKMRDVLGFTPRHTDPEAGIQASLEARPG